MSDGLFRVMVGVLAPNNLSRFDDVDAFSADFHFEAPTLCGRFPKMIVGYEVFNDEYGDANEPINCTELANHHAVQSAKQAWEMFANYAGGKGEMVGDGQIYLVPI